MRTKADSTNIVITDNILPRPTIESIGHCGVWETIEPRRPQHCVDGMPRT